MKRFVLAVALFLGLFAFTGETKAAVFFSQSNGVAFVPTNAFLVNGGVGCGVAGVPVSNNVTFFQRRGLLGGRSVFFQQGGFGGVGGNTTFIQNRGLFGRR